MAISRAQQSALDTIRTAIAAERKKTNLVSCRIPIQIREKLLSLLSDGLPLEVVARETGLSRTSLYRWRDIRNPRAAVADSPTPPPRILVVEPPQTDTSPSDTHSPSTLRFVVGNLVITIATGESA